MLVDFFDPDAESPRKSMKPVQKKQEPLPKIKTDIPPYWDLKGNTRKDPIA